MEEQNKNQNIISKCIDTKELLEQSKTTLLCLEDQILQLNSKSASMYKLTMETLDLFDEKVREFKKSIYEINELTVDSKQFLSYKNYSKYYRKILFISIFVMLSSWALALFGAYSGIKYYTESIRAKQEIRNQIMREINQEGNIIINNQLWKDYQEKNKILKVWQKANPKEGKSLDNYIKAYQTNKSDW